MMADDYRSGRGAERWGTRALVDMRFRRSHRAVGMRPFLIVFIALTPPTLDAQDPLEPHSAETLQAVLGFLDYDETMPFDGHVVATERPLGFAREKIVFRGSRGDRVPSFLALPNGDGPFPLVFLLHAGGSSKEAWWSPTGYERAVELTRGLLESGYAVFAMDGTSHGERTSSIDYVPVRTWYFENEWWASFRTMIVESVADYRRALDYLRTRPELDTSRVGAVGQSMGGITAICLTAADSRITTVVAGSAALAPAWCTSCARRRTSGTSTPTPSPTADTSPSPACPSTEMRAR
jgi:dienelactone hydrolase